jgi:ABC-type bacteriocin/lantibiotic exporter with double-glycine peptidase domain
MSLLSVSHRPQSQQSDCLAACAQMVLDYLHIPITYTRLLDILEVDSTGSYFSKLTKLEPELGLTIELAQGSDDLDLILRYLAEGLPLIAYVNTGELTSYWTVATFHALVVVGLDEELVYVNDPYFADAPKAIPHAEFILAWLEQDYRYGVIRLAESS